MSFLTFGSWNINSRSGEIVSAHLRVLREAGVGVVALQEVVEPYYRGLVARVGASNVAYSLELRPPEPDAPRNRRLGCAVVVLDGSFRLGAAWSLDTTVCPERTLVAELDVDGRRLQVGSFHSPNGSQWGTDKALWFHEVTEWLSSQKAPTVFGIDANTPKAERLSDTDPKKWWAEDSHPRFGNAARRLVGDAPSHGMRDVWRTLNPGSQDFPVSFNRDNRRAKRPEYACRYDFVFASPHLVPTGCEYHFAATARGENALSDHALVTARLERTTH